MLSTTDAFMYAFSEIRKRPLFWTLIALLYVLLGSIQDTFADDDWVLAHIIILMETLLYVAVANIAIIAIANKEYHLIDPFLEPMVFFKACILSVLIEIMLTLPTIVIFISAVFVNIPSDSLVSVAITIAMFLLTVIVLTRFFLAQYYFFDKKNSIWQSLKESWKDSNYKVSLSILSAIIWIIALSIPLLLLDKVLCGFYLHSNHLVAPILELAGAHMYMQLQNKKQIEILG